jgi:VWFA-related protein
MSSFPRLGVLVSPMVFLALLPSAAAAQEPPTFASDVELVTVDAVVLDENGEPVGGLTRGDFELRDEGEPREILTFEALEAPTAPVSVTREERRVSTNEDARPGRVVAVLWDEANLSPLVAEDAKRALPPWLAEQLRAGDHVVLASTGGTWLVADGPGDADRLSQAVSRLGWGRQGLDAPDFISDHEAFEIAFRDNSFVYGVVRRRFEAQGVPGCGQLSPGGPVPPAASAPVSAPIPRSDPCGVLARAMQTASAARNRLRATLQTLERLCEALAVARGRKSVVLVSEGFTRDSDFSDELEAVVRAAQRANAVVTFFDAAGVSVRRGYGAASRGAPVATDQGVAAALALADQAGSERVALATGGSVVKTNDLPGGLEQITRESQAYYLLGFAPTPGVEAGTFRKIELKVDRPDLRVRARRGYTVGAEASEEPEEELRRIFDSPFDLPGHGLRVAAWVFEPVSADLSRILLGVDVARPRVAADRQTTLDLFVQVQGKEHRWRQDREITFPQPSQEATVSNLWYLALMEFELPAGSYRARVVAREPDRSAFGAVAHDFDVPAETWRITTPLLSQALLVADDGKTAVPVPTTRREFEVGGTLHGQFAVYGSTPDPQTGAPLLSGSFTLRPEDGEGRARTGALTLVTAGDGPVACRFGVPLEGLSPGPHELALRVRDQVAGRELEDVEPIVLTAPPGSAARPGRTDAVPSTPSRGAAAPVDAELKRLLERAGRYVVGYEQAFRDIVAEEAYSQLVYARSERDRGGGQRRTTRADLVFVRLENDFLWGSFRDVFEVDGHAVRDRDERLQKLFLSPTSSGLERAREILEESAAYNIGPAVRTINLPTLALAFLHPQNQWRFAFERGGHRTVAGVEGAEIRFEETARPTMVRGEESSDLPAKGRFWVDPNEGTVLRSEVRFLFPPARATASVTTEYRPEPALALWVPSEMREEYADTPGSTWTFFKRPSEATAHYSNYRRFGVAIEEKATLPSEEAP